MPVLKNQRHERFAQLVAQGNSQIEAYKKAGYKDDRAGASRLTAKDNIQTRINELLLAASQRVTVSIADVVNELCKLGFSNMQDYQDFDLSTLTREQAAAVSEVTMETLPGGLNRVKYKLYDKRAALVDLGKHLGAFKEAEEKVAHDNIEINVNFFSPDGTRKKTKTIEHDG